MPADPLDVLFLTHRVPHAPDRGDRITTHHVLRYFRGLGARIRVGALAEDARDVEAIETLRPLVDDVCCPRIRPGLRRLTCFAGIVRGEPLTLPYFRHPILARRVAEWVADRPPDLVFLYSSCMAQYVMESAPFPRIMHFAELDSDKWLQYSRRHSGPLRWVYAREHRRLLEFERRVARTFESSVVVSEAEKELFEKNIPDVTPWVMPNGVDVEHFASRGDDRREPHTVIFTGVMDYKPNVDCVVWFASECWPVIRAEFPDARFLIVGNRPTAAIARLGGQDGVEVTGWVDETPPWFERSAVAIAPLRVARGLQNKVLEAMSMSLPVVASPTAARGLGELPDGCLVTAEGARATTESVLRLLRDPAEARAIGRNAGELIRSRFRWENMFEILDRILAEVSVR